MLLDVGCCYMLLSSSPILCSIRVQHINICTHTYSRHNKKYIDYSLLETRDSPNTLLNYNLVNAVAIEVTVALAIVCVTRRDSDQCVLLSIQFSTVRFNSTHFDLIAVIVLCRSGYPAISDRYKRETSVLT